MPTKTSTGRDALDQAIQRTLHDARVPRGLPAPGADEPSDDELLRVVEGTASREERARVDEAARLSAFTRDRLELLREALAETGHGPGALERAARYVFVVARDALELLRGSTEPVAAPALAWATRSGAGAEPPRDAARPCFYEFTQPFTDVEAHLKIEHVARADAAPSIDVQIQLVADGRPATGARVTLRRGGRTVDSLPVEDNGAATFSGLEKDRYEIDVRRGDQTLGRVHLDFIEA